MQRDCEILTFGKYRGRTPIQIARTDPSYVVWLHDTVGKGLVSRELRQASERLKLHDKAFGRGANWDDDDDDDDDVESRCGDNCGD